MNAAIGPATPPRQPGWPEIALALGIYVIGIFMLALWMLGQPDERAVFRINVAGAVNGVIGLTALLAAYLLRIRDWRAFGFRPATRNWLFAAAALGVFAFGLILLVEAVYFYFVTEPNTQADFEAAARGGLLSMLLVMLTNAVFGPIGEELVFRSVIASGLARYGPAMAVIGSAAFFSGIHGPSVIMLDAFVVGLLLGIVYWRSASIWPAIVPHGVYNGLNVVYYSTL